MSRPPFRKVYVDSKLRFFGTGSDFNLELTDSMQLPDDYSMWVSAVTFPNSWYTIDRNNNKLYVLEDASGTTTARVLTIPDGLYTHSQLATAMVAALGYPVTTSDETLTITPPAPTTIRVPSRFELRSLTWKLIDWDTANTTAPYDYLEPNDMNFMIQPHMESSYVANFQTGIVDLTPHSVLYLHSNLGTYGSIDSAGRKTVIASILVDKAYGQIIHLDHRGLDADSVDVSSQRFKNMRFSLRNAFGQVIDLRGGDMSIELCFGPTRT